MSMSSREVYRNFATEHQTIHDLFETKAEKLGSKQFLQFDDQTYSYAELNAAIDRTGAGFRDLGVDEDDHVGLILPNSPEFLLSWFALCKLGAVPVPINVEYASDETLLTYMLDHGDCSSVVLDSRYLDDYVAVEDNLDDVAFCAVRDHPDAPLSTAPTPTAPVTDFETVRDSPPVGDVPDRTIGDTAMILFTSGTTGRPKGCLIPHGQYLYSGYAMMDFFEYQSSDVHYEPLPLFHIRGSADVISAIAMEGGLALAESFSAETVWDDVREYDATIFNSIASMMALLYNRPEEPDDADNPVRLFLTGPRIEKTRAFEERFDLETVELYGQTEGIPIYTPYDEITAGETPVDAAGKEAPPMSVKLVDQQDREVSQGETGEIVVRPEEPFAIFNGYYKQPEKTVESWQNLWYHTGDYAYFDEDGYMHYVDRKKQIIRKKGENISSDAIEDRVLQYDSLNEAAAVPVQTDSGDLVRLCVKLEDDATLEYEAFIDWCEENMPSLWVPDYVEIRESFPKTATERVQKVKLKEQGLSEDAWSRHDDQ